MPLNAGAFRCHFSVRSLRALIGIVNASGGPSGITLKSEQTFLRCLRRPFGDTRRVAGFGGNVNSFLWVAVGFKKTLSDGVPPKPSQKRGVVPVYQAQNRNPTSGAPLLRSPTGDFLLDSLTLKGRGLDA